MTDSAALDALELHITDLRRAVRAALAEDYALEADRLRGELRRAERAWDAMTGPDPADHDPGLNAGTAAPTPARPAGRAPVTVRQQILTTLDYLGVPTSPAGVADLHPILFGSGIGNMSSLLRDEERSWRASGGTGRPVYICPALFADGFHPIRATLTLSTWPFSRRVYGPLTSRATELTRIMRLAQTITEAPEAYGDPKGPAMERLAHLAQSVPGASPAIGAPLRPSAVHAIASAEYNAIAAADSDARELAGERLFEQARPAEWIWGVPWTR